MLPEIVSITANSDDDFQIKFYDQAFPKKYFFAIYKNFILINVGAIAITMKISAASFLVVGNSAQCYAGK